LAGEIFDFAIKKSPSTKIINGNSL